MARFDVYEYKRSKVSLVIEVQATLLEDLNTCVVVPLLPVSKAKKEPLPRLKPILSIHNKDYILATTDIGTLERKALGPVVENVEQRYRQDIIEALDFLFQGF